MTSGARYSWVPTKDLDRALTGSATSSGSVSSRPSSRGAAALGTGAAVAEELGDDVALEGEVEIGEHDVAVAADEDVLRLEVSVDHSHHVEDRMESELVLLKLTSLILLRQDPRGPRRRSSCFRSRTHRDCSTWPP
ncbi:unnamed protein product [Spirodela intermedia]|uniref:Uncharacterized protein n=1 Tax=Spirodela intermedia TaxID=51605 RepID=A0A7I8JAC0_SPIIN|nr:unnamed protein product [Spirodela intermedia]CAA6666372.1 unnamed protein product [Spirodela intermedia]